MKIWPRSLMGQMMLAVAVALLLAQGVGAFLAYRAAYKDMSAYGLLGQIAATKRTRALAAHVNRALAEATDFLDTMDAARLGLSMPEVEHG